MLADHAFDLAAINVLATTDEYVLHAIQDEKEPFLVHPRHVARLHPAFPQRLGTLLRTLPVPLDDIGASYDKLARRSGRDIAILCVDDAEVIAGHARARAVWPGDQVFGAVRGDGGGRFGHPVGTRQKQARKAPRQRRVEIGSSRCATISDCLERTQIVIAIGFGLNQLPRHRWNGNQRIDPLALDEFEGRFHVPLMHQDHAGARSH